LATIVAKSRELGYQGIELEARLALAEIEIKAGQMAAGRAHLTANRSRNQFLASLCSSPDGHHLAFSQTTWESNA
jgi:hypothetical protein